MAEIIASDPTPQKSMLEACFFGFLMPYLESLSLMHTLHREVVQKKIPNQLMLLEHEPVITVTQQHLYKNLKTSLKAVEKSGITLAIADRGGDATFHGPGQLVGYPIISLIKDSKSRFVDVSLYIRSLEQGLLNAVKALGITKAQLLPGFTGIWIKIVDSENRLTLKKLVAIGVGIKDGVSKHGFAMNIDIDHQRYVEHITPCGLKDRGVITLKEVFYLESLEMPSYSAIVDAVSQSLSQALSLTLTWRT